MSWYSDVGNNLKETTLLTLYQECQKSLISNIELHYKYRNYFTGVLQFRLEIFSLLFIAIPAIIAFLSIMAKKTSDRYYRRFLENVVMIGKIENILGIDGSIEVGNRKPSKIVWPEDKQFIPLRYFEDRFSEKISEDFIEKRMKMGDNKLAHDLFSFFEYASIAIIAVTVIFLLSLYFL